MTLECLFDASGAPDPRCAEGVETLRTKDAKLRKLIDRTGPFRMQRQPAREVFEALAEAVVYQQLTAKAAGTIYGRVLALFPEGLTAERLAACPEDRLRSAGLSRSKAASLLDLAAKASTLPSTGDLQSLSDEEIIRRLTVVRGVGPWTVHMFLMFRMGRPDVLPTSDYGVRKGFALTYGGELPTSKVMEKQASKWRPYRSIASWYLWRALET